MSQGAGLGDAARGTLFGSCRGFARAEEGTQGLPHTPYAKISTVMYELFASF